MQRRPDTPQLPLDFDAPLSSEGTAAAKPQSNVVSFSDRFFRRLPRPIERSTESVDSVLDEVLSNARRLNW